MGASRPRWALEDSVSTMLWLDSDTHKAAKRCAMLERRSMQAFCAEAVAEKVRRMLEDDIADDRFVPPGTRRR